MKSNFIALLSRMKYIARWGLMRNSHPENVQEHSLQVAMIAHCLAVIARDVFGKNINVERAVVIAMYHDVGEILTGDLPTPVKYYDANIKSAYGNIEDIAKERELSLLPPALLEGYRDAFFPSLESDAYLERLVKAADKLSAYIKCIEEEGAGNSEFKKAGQALYQIVKNTDLAEVAYFIDTFIEGFSLTLDEI